MKLQRFIIVTKYPLIFSVYVDTKEVETSQLTYLYSVGAKFLI